MKIDFHNLQFVECFIAETSLIERLCIPKKDNKINFQLFSNLLYSPIDRDDFMQYRGFYIAINVLREKMGFKKDEKPGDFDVLIIPHSDGNMFFERTCAIEVKVVRPTRQKPKKSPNSNGITQIQGLIKDGFPLIGLIHICMPEPLLDIEKHTIKLYTTPIDMDNPKNNRSFSDESVDMYLDSFSQFSSENQMKN